jgi:hypothetical protein
VREDQIRDEVASRLSSVNAALPTSVLKRPVRLVSGLARAGTRWLARAARRRREDIEPESTVTGTFGELKGVTMKLGQVLGYTDLGLPRNLAAALSALHTHAQPLPFDRIREVLERELGPAGRVLAQSMRPDAAAAGSIGQVHRSRLPDGSPVAVKVLYPGVSETIARDLAPATLGGRVAALIYPGAQLQGWVREVRARVLAECDYALEARRQQRFAELFAGHETIVVPTVHRAWCSPRVLTTRFVDGLHLEAWLGTSPGLQARERAASALFDFYAGALFGHGVYNCDPHPGNFLFMADGRLAFVDFGSTQELAHEARVALRQLAREVLDGLSLPRTPRRANELGISAELPFLLRTVLGVSSALERLDTREDWRARLRRLLEPEVAPPPPVAVPPEPSAYDVVLLDPGQTPIGVVRAIRDFTGMNLRDVRDLIENAPRMIRRAVPRADARKLQQRLESAGARIELKPV